MSKFNVVWLTGNAYFIAALCGKGEYHGMEIIGIVLFLIAMAMAVLLEYRRRNTL